MRKYNRDIQGIIGGKQMSETSDSFVTIILILVASVLVFVVPIVYVSGRNDQTSSQEVQAAVTEFANNVCATRNNKKRRL